MQHFSINNFKENLKTQQTQVLQSEKKW